TGPPAVQHGTDGLSVPRAGIISVSRTAPLPAGPGDGWMLTKKGKYGLKALMALAALEPDQLAQVGGIAERNSIPRKFLDTILGELRNAGFVHSRKGKSGGYGL